MEIIIPLPSRNSINTIEELNRYLKQLELAVHYAQKSVKNAIEMGVELTDDLFVAYSFPSLDEEIRESNWEELQDISLQINLQ